MYKNKKKGQAIVEMAIVFPFFLLIVVGGVIDFGFAFYNYLSLQQIANDTARWSTENKFNEDTRSEEICSYANKLKPEWWTGSYTVHTPELIPLESDPGSKAVVVTLTYDSPALTPFYQIMFKSVSGVSSIKLSTKAAYKIPDFLIPKS